MLEGSLLVWTDERGLRRGGVIISIGSIVGGRLVLVLLLRLMSSLGRNPSTKLLIPLRGAV